MHNLLPRRAFYLNPSPALQLRGNKFSIARINAAQHKRKEMAVKHSGAHLGAKGPFGRGVGSTALPAVLYDLFKDGLQVGVGFGHNGWPESYAVVLVVAT